nr:putative frv operon regulatory protein [uncultured Enterobacter sp.]
MLNERQLALLEHLENQPQVLAELARLAGVSARTIMRDLDYLNFTLSGKARISTTGNATWQLDIIDRKSYFQLLQRHDNDDQMLALLLLNAFTTRTQLADALNMPEAWVSDKLTRLKQRYEKWFSLAGRPGAGYFIDEPEAKRVIILANLLKKDPTLLAMNGVFLTQHESSALPGYPDIPRDYLVSVILAVYALRNRLDTPAMTPVSDALILCVEKMGLYLHTQALQTLAGILDALQYRASLLTPERIAALLEQVRDKHPPAIIDTPLIDDLTAHLVRCAATPVWLAESRQSSLNNLKAAWPAAFDMSIRFIALLREQLNLQVFDSDLIGLYFACSLERNQTERQPVILLSDQNAIATINKMAIERDVLNCRVVIAHSLNELDELLHAISPVCIINNSHFRPADTLKNILTIKNIITPAGIGQIKDHVESAFIRQNIDRLFPADGSFHFENTALQSWDSVIAQICARLKAAKLLSAEETARLCQREREGENLIVNRLAIPHCWSEEQPTFRGYFITLAHPLTVNHEPVSHVLVACASSTARQELKIFSYLASVLHRHPAEDIAALKAYGDFIGMFKE